MRAYTLTIVRPVLFWAGIVLLSVGVGAHLGTSDTTKALQASLQGVAPAFGGKYADGRAVAKVERAARERIAVGRQVGQATAEWALEETTPRKEAIWLADRVDQRAELRDQALRAEIAIRRWWVALGALLMALGGLMAVFGLGIRLDGPTGGGETSRDPARSPRPATATNTTGTAVEPEPSAAGTEVPPEPPTRGISVKLTIQSEKVGTKVLELSAPADSNLILKDLKLDCDPIIGSVEVYTHHND